MSPANHRPPPTYVSTRRSAQVEPVREKNRVLPPAQDEDSKMSFFRLWWHWWCHLWKGQWSRLQGSLLSCLFFMSGDDEQVMKIGVLLQNIPASDFQQLKAILWCSTQRMPGSLIISALVSIESLSLNELKKTIWSFKLPHLVWNDFGVVEDKLRFEIIYVCGY